EGTRPGGARGGSNAERIEGEQAPDRCVVRTDRGRAGFGLLLDPRGRWLRAPNRGPIRTIGTEQTERDSIASMVTRRGPLRTLGVEPQREREKRKRVYLFLLFLWCLTAAP